MSDYDNDFEDFEGDEDNSPAGLRKALKRTNAKLAAAEKRAQEAEAKAAEATKTVTKNTLSELLTKKGIKPGLVRFLEQDGVEATPDAVDAWVKENGEFFNIQSAEDKDEQQQEPAAEQGDETLTASAQLPPELVAAIQASQQLDASGVSPSEVGVLQRIQSVSTDPSKISWDQLVADLKGAGVPTDTSD